MEQDTSSSLKVCVHCAIVPIPTMIPVSAVSMPAVVCSFMLPAPVLVHISAFGVISVFAILATGRGWRR